MQTHHIKALVAGLVFAGVVWSQAAPASPQGVITAKEWLNIGGGTAVTDLTGNARFPDNPDIITYPTYFEIHATGDINTAAPADVYGNSGGQIVGYFYPPSTGDYVFWIASDDGGNLYLSTDATAENKKTIAVEAGWSNPRSYTVVGGTSTVEAKCSQTYTATQWPVKDTVNGGAKITLQANQPYYIEAVFKEGGGGDNLSVAVQDPGFSIDTTKPIPGQYLSSFDKATGPLTITTEPQSQTINEGSPVTFSVVVNGTPPYTFVWRKDGTPFATNAQPSYTIARVSRTDNGAAFSVVVTGGQGTATSANATLTVVTDNTPPTLVSAGGSATFRTATVTFSEPVDPTTAQTAGNYQISGGVTVSAAALGAPAGQPGDNRVILTTSQQAENASLTLTVNNVKDVAGNTIAANSTIDFKTFKAEAGWASYARWHNESGDPGDIATFAQSVASGSIRAPDFTGGVQQFGAPWGARDNYAAKVSGFFIPPSNGNYVFFIGSDDQSYLYLSTDADPANKKLIAQETAWSNQYQFTTSGGGSDLTAKRSDQFVNTEWPNFNTITLVGQTRYYIEALMDEGGGGDGVDVTFIKEGEADPSNDTAGMHMRGSVIATFLDPSGASITISQPPQDVTQQEQRTATFTVVATGTSAYGGTVNYQWQRQAPGAATWTDLAGATAASYVTPVLALADTGAKYRVICTVPTLTETSATATLTVVPDTFPPKLEAAGSIVKGTAVEIGVGFDENVDPTTAGATANYTLSKGTVTGVRYQKFAHTDGAPFFVLGTAGPHYGAAVVLTTSGLVAGDTVGVTVKNIKDVKGNTMAAAGETKTLIVTSKMKWAAMGGDDYLQGETGGQNITPDPALWVDDVVAYNDADFDLVSSGTANWNNYDEATFVYEEVTGDFDKVVRIEFHDPTSQWARAGLCATPSADEGMTRASVNSGAAMMEKRFMQRVNPAVQWNGSAGNNQHEVDWRLTKGGNYGGAGAGNPAYPNAWLRMQRIGQTFNAFYSADGKNWTAYGNTTFTDEPMPATLLVGPYYSPEYGNNTTGEGVGHSAVGKFRQYGSFVAKPSQVTYGVGLNFGADEPNGGFGGILPSIGTAGVPGVIQGNWNNLTNATGSSTAILADKLGVAQPTAVSVAWTCPNTWASTGRGEENNGFTDNDRLLMTGYLDTGGATTTTVDISGIPTDLTADKGYDVYIYALGGVASRGGGYRIVDGTNPSNPLTSYVDIQGPANPTAFVVAVPAPGAWVPATVVKFSGLKASSIQVQATTEGGHAFGGTPRAPINAIQLVPSTGEAPGEMTVSLSGGNVTINWAGGGTLQSATSVLGPWTNVGTTKPYSAPASAPAMYFRVEGQ